MKTVNIYLNSDINSTKKANGKYMYILELMTEKEPITLTATEKVETATKNEVHIMGLAKALSRLKGECELCIYLENEYVYNSINHYLPGWKERGWKNSKNEEIKNIAEWQYIASILEKYNYQLQLHQDHAYRDWILRELRKE